MDEVMVVVVVMAGEYAVIHLCDRERKKRRRISMEKKNKRSERGIARLKS